MASRCSKPKENRAKLCSAKMLRLMLPNSGLAEYDLQIRTEATNQQRKEGSDKAQQAAFLLDNLSFIR